MVVENGSVATYLNRELQKRILFSMVRCFRSHRRHGHNDSGLPLPRRTWPQLCNTPGKDYLKGNNDLFSLTQPQAIIDIHKEYLAAGADIIEQNTFSPPHDAIDYMMSDLAYELNKVGAELGPKSRARFTPLREVVCGRSAGADESDVLHQPGAWRIPVCAMLRLVSW
jgi:methionine synthase I (cobalamin-dependent)